MSRRSVDDHLRRFQRTIDDVDLAASTDRTVSTVTVIRAMQYIRGVATRAVCALQTELNTRESVEELDGLIEILDRYRDVLPPEA